MFECLGSVEIRKSIKGHDSFRHISLSFIIPTQHQDLSSTTNKPLNSSKPPTILSTFLPRPLYEPLANISTTPSSSNHPTNPQDRRNAILPPCRPHLGHCCLRHRRPSRYRQTPLCRSLRLPCHEHHDLHCLLPNNGCLGMCQPLCFVAKLCFARCMHGEQVAVQHTLLKLEYGMYRWNSPGASCGLSRKAFWRV